MAKTTWTPNETQKKFIEVLKGADKPMTLDEIAKAMGVEKLATGSINTLLTKGMVDHGEDAEVYVTVKKKVSTYKLAE